MTREEAIEVIKAYRDKLTNSASNQLDGDIEALEMAIQALEKENIYDDKEHYVTISKALYDKLNIDYEQALSQEPCDTYTEGYFKGYDDGLEQKLEEPCDDVVSRDMALEKMADYVASGCADSAEDFEEYSRIICQLPSVTQKSGEWIPVSERLPEDAYGCLVTVYDTDLRTQDEFENILPYTVGYDGETWNNADGEPIPFEVIAWMPLPKLYEPQESEG